VIGMPIPFNYCNYYYYGNYSYNCYFSPASLLLLILLSRLLSNEYLGD
jgi:hypothetical protein